MQADIPTAAGMLRKARRNGLLLHERMIFDGIIGGLLSNVL
jgi:hypothetical protein